MSKIIGFLLLLIIVSSFQRVTASPARPRVIKKLIRRCRCRVLHHGVFKCPSPLLPSNPEEEMDLIKCICNRTNLHKFPKMRETCVSSHRGTLSTPL